MHKQSLSFWRKQTFHPYVRLSIVSAVGQNDFKFAGKKKLTGNDCAIISDGGGGEWQSSTISELT